MNANTNRPVPIERASSVAPDHIDEELRRYEGEKILARLQEPNSRIKRYQAPDTLIDFLKTLRLC